MEDPKSVRRIGLRKRLVIVIGAAFFVPYLCMTLLTLMVDQKMEYVKQKATESYLQTNTTLREALEATSRLFRLSAIRKSETIADEISLIISLKNLSGESVRESKALATLLQTERIGEDSQISIIDPAAGIIVLDKYFTSGSRLGEKLPLVGGLLHDKRYLRIQDQLRGKPTLLGNRGTVSDFLEVEGRRKEESEKKPAQEPEDGGKARFVVVTPIKGTPYALSVVTTIGGLTRSAFAELENSLGGINTNLLDIDKQSQNIKFYSFLFLGLGALFGVIIGFLIVRITKRRILDPVSELKQTAELIRRGQYERRVNLTITTDDYRELGVAINRMLDTTTELIQSEEQKKELQQNIIELLNLVSRASEGDLSGRGRISQDVLGSVADAFNLMLDGMSSLITRVKQTGRQISQGALSILETSRKIAVDAKRQGREIHTVTGKVQLSSRSMQRVSISADMANEEAQRATVAAKDGAMRVNETIQSMQKMRSNVQATAKTIKNLGDRSLEINAIVELINDISSRTNILSLNAAIEASRAGEQGKGFAVVADEIRKLAERTTNATKEISTFIEDIQIETNDAVLAMEEVTREVEQGWRQSDQAGTALKDIQSVIAGAAEKIKDISRVSADMVNQMDVVVSEFKSIYQVTRETTDGIYRASNETKKLLLPLEKMTRLLNTFRLREKEDEEKETAVRAASAVPLLSDSLEEAPVSAADDEPGPALKTRPEPESRPSPQLVAGYEDSVGPEALPLGVGEEDDSGKKPE